MRLKVVEEKEEKLGKITPQKPKEEIKTQKKKN